MAEYLKFTLGIYETNPHTLLFSMPIYAAKLTATEWAAINASLGTSTSSSGKRTLIDANGDLTQYMSTFLQYGINRASAPYFVMPKSKTAQAAEDLQIALNNARIVMKNSFDASSLFLSFFDLESGYQTKSISYSFDGIHFENSTIVYYYEPGFGNYSVSINGSLKTYVGTAGYSNQTSPTVSIPVITLVENNAYYQYAVQGGPGYSVSVMAQSAYTANGNDLLWTSRAAGVPGTPEPPTDPYAEVPTSGQAGGDGSANWTGTDDIDFPTTPGLSAVNAGFISLWAPTDDQMLKLSSYMWNADVFTIEFWKKLWADPLDVIYGLNIIPLDLRATGRTIIGGTKSVIVGLVDTGVPMDYLTEQWIELNCGSISLAEVWGAYLDYDPFTKLEIYLPYCGVHPLRVDDFMSGTITLKYKIDLLSGACIALIKSDKPNDGENDLSSIVYQFMGNCATQIPVTATQFADAVRSVISLAASVGTMIATSGAGAVTAGATGATGTQLAEKVFSGSAATVENVMNIKPAIERSGAIGAAAGLLSVQTPYLIITRPRQAHPEEQNKFTGYPSFITETLGDLTGWTIVKDIHLENIPCTADELSEIDSLLKSGVIF